MGKQERGKRTAFNFGERPVAINILLFVTHKNKQKQLNLS